MLNKFGGTAKFVFLALEVVEVAGDEKPHKEAWDCKNLNFEPKVNSSWGIITGCMGEKLPVSLVHKPISEEDGVAHRDCSKKCILDFDVQSLLCLSIVIPSDDNVNGDQLEKMSQAHGSNGNLLIIV